jgi:hyperpolarization activated cyclic nucleotide-gated potassium channel 2
VRKIIQIFFLWLVCQHIVSCFWYFAAKLDNFSPNTWVVRNEMSDDTYTLYVNSFFWAAMTITSIGYGDIAAYTSSEYTLTILWLLIGMGFYSIIIGTNSPIKSTRQRRSDHALNR